MKNVITRFGVLSRIITDNGTQFASAAFTEYYEELGTKICFASVAHPQSNGQVERANNLVLQGMKRRIYDRLSAHRKAWVTELPTVLWAIRTTASQATGETPFFLVYEAEAMLPHELELRSSRVELYADKDEPSRREDALNAIEEKRDQVLLRVAKY